MDKCKPLTGGRGSRQKRLDGDLSTAVLSESWILKFNIEIKYEIKYSDHGVMSERRKSCVLTTVCAE